MTNPILDMQQNTGKMYSELDSLNKEVSVDSLSPLGSEGTMALSVVKCLFTRPHHQEQPCVVRQKRYECTVVDGQSASNGLLESSSTQPAMTRDLSVQFSDESVFSILTILHLYSSEESE